MRIRHAGPVAMTLALLGAAPLVRAEETTAPPPALAANGIEWHRSVADAFAAGIKEKKPIFIAINAGRVDGGQAEPAGKMLREDVYPSSTIVDKARGFSCALVTAEGNGADYGELRQRFGIDGQIVSPQHIFAYSDGSLIDRREYWTPRGTAASIEALGAMFDRALASERARAGMPPAAPTPAPAAPGMDDAPGMDPAAPDDPARPPVDPARAAWIETTLARIKQAGNDKDGREAAIREMVRGDQKFDCLEPLCALFAESKKDAALQIALVRGFGKPGLEYAVPTVMTALDDKNDELRSNAAVTLEYIGSPRAVDALTKRLPREKEEAIFANVCRALGRCGAKMDAVRKTLLKEMGSAKSDRTLAGPVIGLAYLEKDADVARALEKQAKKEAYFGRAILLWAMTEVNDPKSADFVRKEIIPGEKFGPALTYDNNVVKALGGDETAQGAVEGGMRYVAGLIGGIGDTARRGREGSGFEPKGEFGDGGPGGGRGPGGGMPPGGPGMGGGSGMGG